jgi:hypothetical protein
MRGTKVADFNVQMRARAIKRMTVVELRFATSSAAHTSV